MDKAMKDEFIQMLKDERGTPQGWSVIMAMVDMLADDDEFEQMAEIHKGMAEYGQFLTEKEAKRIVDKFENYDGTRGPKWSMPQMMWDKVEALGGRKAEKGKYNCWALFVMMNAIHSDYGGVLMTLVQGNDEYAKACYMMAVAKLTDKDRRWTIREYYGLE
jgi:hypothetical protein